MLALLSSMQELFTVNRDKDGRSLNTRRAPMNGSRQYISGVNVTETIFLYDFAAIVLMVPSCDIGTMIGPTCGKAAEDLPLISKSRTWTAFRFKYDVFKVVGT